MAAKRKPRAGAAAGKSPSIPTPRPASRGRTIPRGAATNLPDTMRPPFMGASKMRGGIAKAGRKKVRSR